MNKEELKQYIDDNIYENQDGEITGESLNAVLKAIVDDGGTEVEANPTGEPTETLGKLKIGETIYTAPQGPQGAPGPANTLSIGTVTDGEQASASITGDAPSQKLNLVLPKGEKGDTGNDAVNPFKGWFNTFAELKDAYTAIEGDSAYVKDASPATTWSIYVYDSTASSNNYWADSGRDADTTEAQTFASGEEVNQVHIINNLVNGGVAEVLSAEQGKELFKRYSDIKDIPLPPVNPYVIGTGSNKWYGYSNSEHYELPVVPNTEYLIKANQNLECVFCVLRTLPNTFLNTIESTLADYATGWNEQIVLPQGKEMLVKIPSDGYALIVWKNLGTTGDRTPESIKMVSDKYSNYDLVKEVLTSKIYDFGIGANRKWVGGSDYYYHFRGVAVPIEGLSEIDVTPSIRGSLIAFLSDFDEQDVIIGQDVSTLLSLHVFYDEEKFNVPYGAKYIFVDVSSTYEAPPFFFPQKIAVIDSAYKGVIANEINYFTVQINSKQLGKNWDSSVMQDDTVTNDVGAAIILPSSYLPTGKPTSIVATLHGANGWVTADNFGQHNSQNWDRYINNLLSNGYAVFDVNGYGVGEFNVTTNIAPSSWGCPRAVEAMKKAFDYIVENYNVEKQMYIHGLSAGGCLGYSFTMNYPDCVKAVSMFEPSQPTNNVKENHQSSDAERWYDIVAIAYGYNNWQSAVADNFANFVGYSLPLSFVRLNNGNLETIGNLPLSEEIVSGLFGSFPRPIRIYQGSQQTGMVSISQELNENIVNALNNGGCNASLRLAPGATHGDFVGSSAIDYIIAEELLFFKRF